MRSLNEIKADVDAATNTNDSSWMHTLAAEVMGQGAADSRAWSANLEGLAFRMAGQYPEAIAAYERGLAEYSTIGDKVGIAGTTANLGTVYAGQGDLVHALDCFRRAASLREELHDEAGVASALGNIGSIYANTGDYPQALKEFERALSVFDRLGNRAAVAMLTDNIGNVYMAASDYPRALERYRRALAVHEEAGDLSNVARVTGNIGNVYANIGDWDKAQEQYQCALDLYEELGDRAGIAFALSSVGVVYNSIGDNDKAMRQFRQARDIASELGDRARLARYSTNIMTSLILLGSIDQAAQLLEDVEGMSPDDPEIRVQVLISRSTLQEHNGDLEGAHATLLRALDLATQAGLKMRMAESHRSLRDLARKRNELETYIEHSDAFHRIMEEINGRKVTQQLDMIETQQQLDAIHREREKEQAILYGALPKEIADRLIGGDDVSGDEYTSAAVLFLDITESTKHSSVLSAKQVVSLLSTMFSTFDDIAADHGLMKIKTIGDAYMAVAFAEGSQERGARSEQSDRDHVERAARAALDMLASPFTWPDGSNVQFRVGLHAGPLVAGIIGKQRLQYDVWGDTVNVASRMESTSEPGRIQVSESIAITLKGAFPVAERGEIEIKGKGMMKTYWLEGAV